MYVTRFHLLLVSFAFFSSILILIAIQGWEDKKGQRSAVLGGGKQNHFMCPAYKKNHLTAVKTSHASTFSFFFFAFFLINRKYASGWPNCFWLSITCIPTVFSIGISRFIHLLLYMPRTKTGSSTFFLKNCYVGLLLWWQLQMLWSISFKIFPLSSLFESLNKPFAFDSSVLTYS